MRVARWLVVGAVVLAGCSQGGTSGPIPPPSLNSADLAATFEGLGEGPVDATGEFTPDGRRVADVLLVQGALTRYRAEFAVYPESPALVVPRFLPSLPVDPASGEPYAYAVVDGGQDYRIAATLSNGRTFSGVPHDGR